MTAPAKVRCPDCNGRCGTTVLLPSLAGQEIPVFRKCLACDGYGYIPRFLLADRAAREGES